MVVVVPAWAIVYHFILIMLPEPSIGVMEHWGSPVYPFKTIVHLSADRFDMLVTRPARSISFELAVAHDNFAVSTFSLPGELELTIPLIKGAGPQVYFGSPPARAHLIVNGWGFLFRASELVRTEIDVALSEFLNA